MSDYYPPMKGLATDAEVLAAIQHVVDRLGSQKVAAALLQVDPKVLSDILYQRRIIPMSLAFRLGFVPAWNFIGVTRRDKK